ncbi:hypothetical protein BU23DRAFT_552513 [Bimuria novae-zelandiae CBS 107.79]|uniref:Exosome complex protein n=1 Tax=Bimuria novae-zelandiae CBS 107.79 TaxID=1447943 RepID=A0A6A5VKR0_9PLEO|nr:hypothetical protein BU23DRAFT_552513 [Bimuria novae-zelandiae CBS 107.79]
MDPETNLPDLTEDLADTIDDLEDALQPLLSKPLTSLTSTLPTLDKAKLHILTAYTLESLLFQALQASGADTKSHKVFAELARLKTYFGKVKDAEAAGEGKGGPTTKLDKDAAARFIRHGLSGNERYDKERAERQAKEKARAALKAKQMARKVNKKFDDGEESKLQEELGKKRKAEAVDEDDSGSNDDKGEDIKAPEEPVRADIKAPEEPVRADSEEDHIDSENAEFYGDGKDEMDVDAPAQNSTPATTPAKKSKKEKKDKKDKEKKQSKRRRSAKYADNDAPREPEGIIPERGEASKTHSETFNALLAGTFAEQKKETKKSKKSKKA